MTKHFSPLVGKPSTGEPDAGEPHVRFGGRGGATQCVVPTPMCAKEGGTPGRFKSFSGKVLLASN